MNADLLNLHSASCPRPRKWTPGFRKHLSFYILGIVADIRPLSSTSSWVESSFPTSLTN